MITIILYLVGFIRTVLVILAIYFLIKFITRVFNQPNQNTDQRKTERKKTGETTIRFNKKGEKKFDKNTGEYVDFEEVDD